jgi:hypothetical protein
MHRRRQPVLYAAPLGIVGEGTNEIQRNAIVSQLITGNRITA